MTSATIDISEARSEFHRLDERLTEDQVLFVTRHRERAFAVTSVAFMDAVCETLEILADPKSAEMLLQSIRDIREDRLRSHEEVEAEFGRDPVD